MAVWAHILTPLTKRLTWNLFSGFENDHGRYLPFTSNIVRDFTYASNLAYRLSPNVIVSFEGLQMRTHLQSGLGTISQSLMIWRWRVSFLARLCWRCGSPRERRAEMCGC